MRRTTRFVLVSLLVTCLLFICSVGPIFLTKRVQGISSNNNELNQAKRLSVLQKGCQALFHRQIHYSNASIGHLKIKDPPSSLALELRRGFGFCWSFKAASSSLGAWMVEATNTSKYLQNQTNQKILLSMQPQSVTELQRFLTYGQLFIVVRHPFARVVSAFNDRIIGDTKSYQSRKFVPLIKKKLALPTNFVKALSFRHFVIYLLSTPTQDYDPHWSPMWKGCSPCQIPYRYIVKVETLAQDFQFVQEQNPNMPRHALPLLHQSPLRTEPGPDMDVTRKHWQELKPQEKDAFYKIYKNDYLLFGYDKNAYE